MTTVLTVIHVLVCFFLVVIVLLQHGKGADMGATFGGSSQTVFGSDGPLPLMNKVTTGSAIVFMVTSIALAYLSAHMSTNSVMKNLAVPKPISTTIERVPATEVEQPDVKLGTEEQQKTIEENVESPDVAPAIEDESQENISPPPEVTQPAAEQVEQKATEITEKVEETVSKPADEVKAEQPAASEFEKQLATEQEKTTEPEKKE